MLSCMYSGSSVIMPSVISSGIYTTMSNRMNVMISTAIDSSIFSVNPTLIY